MDGFYALGWLLAFVLGMFKLMASFSVMVSIRSQNLKKINLHFSPWTGTFSTNETSKLSVLLFVAYILVIAPVFSWLSVLVGTWFFVSQWTNRVEVPDKIKELQFKIATIQLSKDDLVSIQHEMNSILGTNSAILGISRDSLSNERDNTLVLEKGEWYSEVEIDPVSKSLTYYGHTPDYDSVFHSTDHYQLDGMNVLVRTFEDFVDNYGKKRFNIRDNVVLESDIRKRHSEAAFTFRSVDEVLAQYQECVLLRPTPNLKIKLFVLSRHPENIHPLELRKWARKELETIKSLRFRFTQDAKAEGLSINEEEVDLGISIPDGTSEAKLASIRVFMGSLSSRYGMDLHQIRSSAYQIEILQEFLGEKVAA